MMLKLKRVLNSEFISKCQSSCETLQEENNANLTVIQQLKDSLHQANCQLSLMEVNEAYNYVHEANSTID